MRRSVISSTIAAVVLCSGAGFAGTAPAVAEPSQPGQSNGPDELDNGATTRGPRAAGRGSATAETTGATGSPTGALPLWPWPCPWPVVPPVIPPVAAPVAGGGAVIPAIPGFVVPVVPQAQISGGVQRTIPEFGELGDLEALSVPEERALPAAAEAPALRLGGQPGGQTAPAPGSGPAGPVWSPPPAWVPPVIPAPAAAPPAATPAGPSAVAAPPRGVQPPAPAPQVSGPAPGSVGADPARAGYPEALRTADGATLAAKALPGLAAILGLTAVGALLGYRQAKAGSALRAAGAGRFLQ